jgi:hypothetical protein
MYTETSMHKHNPHRTGDDGLLAGWRTEFIFPALALLLFTIQAIYFWHFSIDDVAISYRYAQHLAEGYGLSWNIDGPRVEGYSNFLWVLILSAAKWLGSDIEFASKLLGLALGWANIAVLATLCRRFYGTVRFWWAPLFVVVLTPEWVMWMMSGLELALFGALLLLSVMALTSTRSMRVWILSFSLPALLLTRPEGLIYSLMLLFLGLLIDRERTWRIRLRILTPPLAAVILTGVGLLIFRLYYFGYPMPNTVYAKVDGSLPSLGHVLEWLYFAAPFLFGWILLWPKRHRLIHRIALGACLLTVLAQMLVVLPVNPVMYIRHRYQIALLPLLVIALPVLLSWLYDRRRWLSGIVAALVILWCAKGWPEVKVLYERYMIEGHHCIADLLQSLPGDPTVALQDAGRIPYFSGLRALDAWGLCDVETARRGFSSYATLAHRPEVYVISADILGDAKFEARLGMDAATMKNPTFLEDYFLWALCTGHPDTKMWRYDYMLFVRHDWADHAGIDKGMKIYER